MGLHPICGHQDLLSRLEGAIASGRFPQAALLVGPPGVGKQRIALWVAQALLCDEAGGAPCESCQGCRLAVGLSHPDLHWFVPIPRPKSSDPTRQVEEAAELLGEAMAERRDGITRPPDGMLGHPIASIRRLHRVAGLTPFKAKRKVLIVGDAERLVLQESSPEAANALLKVLEEPPRDTTLILTAADLQALLPTIRSRVVPIRVRRVSDDAVREFLTSFPTPPVTGRALARRVDHAQGCIGAALWLDDEGATAADAAAGRVLAATRGGAATWSTLALGQAPWAARGAFTDTLEAMALSLRRDIETLAGRNDTVAVARRLAALRRVEETRAEAAGNLNPQLALAALAHDLEALA